MKLILWIKNNWKDPVWSKVFAGIILFVIGLVATYLAALYKQIPVKLIYHQLSANHVQISFLHLIEIGLVILAFLFPMIFLDVIRFQLKHLKFPKAFRSKKFDLQKFLEGQWTEVYSKPGFQGSETVRFEQGNHYYRNNSWDFVLADIQFNEETKDLSWKKVGRYTTRIHSTEILKIADANTIKGTDDLGLTIVYSRSA